MFCPLVLYTHCCFIHIGTFFKGRADAPETHTLLFPHTESQVDADVPSPRGHIRIGLTFHMREKQRMCFRGIRTTFKEGTNVYKAAMCIKRQGTKKLTSENDFSNSEYHPIKF